MKTHSLSWLSAVACSLVLGGSWNLPAQSESRTGPSPGQMRARMEERKTAVENLKHQLENAETPEAKRKLIDAWPARTEAGRAERIPFSHEPKSSREAFAEMKARAAGNPEMTARLAKLEQRLEAVQSLKTTMAAIQKAEGEEKKRLMAQFQRERQEFAQAGKREMEAGRAEMKARQAVEDAKPLTPERQEVEALKAALKEALPQERRALIDAWREKQEQARTERMQQLEKKARP